MKVFFLPGAYDGCYYYRCYLPGVYGNMEVVLDFHKKEFNADELYKKAMQADIIVIQRANEPIRYELAKLLKSKGKKIVFENDDTYLPGKGVPLKMLPSEKQRDIAKKMNYYLYETLKISDRVITSTPLLAEEYRKINKNVTVIPNYIDPIDEEECLPNDTGKYRIGFIGSVTSNNDYNHIKDQIKALAERGDTTIVVFGIKQQITERVVRGYQEDYDFWNSLPNIEWQPFVPITEYYHTIAKLKLDLVIIPRNESYFNRCKSNLKFLEASLLKIPVIAQGFTTNDSPYEQNPEDSKHMVIVKDNNLWYNTIIELLEDKEKRESMAQKAYDYVVTNYNINNHVYKWHDIFKSL